MSNKSLISNRAIALKPSLTLEIAARAKALMKEGRDICSLSAGEPNFETPQFIVEAAKNALDLGFTKYGPASGDPELKEALAEKLTIWNEVPTTAEEILVTNGGKQAIYNLFQVILNPGDEVLIPAPYWLSYPEIVRLAGGIPKIISSSSKDNFKLKIEDIERLISKNTKLLILNSPNNPTGNVLTEEEMKSIAKLLRKYTNICVMSDEIYELLLGENQKHYSFASIAPDLKQRVFTINGFAKGWAMTGWRLGYLAGNKDVIKAASALQSQSTSNVCSFAQRGALAAIKGPKDCIHQMNKKYYKRRNLLVDGLLSIRGVSLVKPQGAFYAFPRLPEGHRNSVDFCNYALDNYGLALVPGFAFGDNECIRLSCAVSSKNIEIGINKLKNAIEIL